MILVTCVATINVKQASGSSHSGSWYFTFGRITKV
jgi:hypothetical protein